MQANFPSKAQLNEANHSIQRKPMRILFEYTSNYSQLDIFLGQRGKTPLTTNNLLKVIGSNFILYFFITK